MNYIQIAEWETFQHYKHRDPPWIKLYSKLLDDDDFDRLPDDSKLLFYCLLLFASRRKNKIGVDFGWLQKKLPIKKRVSWRTLQPLIDAKFIVCYQGDSKEQASCKQNALPEKSRVEKSREEYSDSFLSFWQKFKGRWIPDKGVYRKGGKAEAFAVWRTLTLEQQKRASEAASKTGDKFTKDACRWLTNRRWEDFEESEKPISEPKPQEAKPVKFATPEEMKVIRQKMKDALPKAMQRIK